MTDIKFLHRDGLLACSSKSQCSVLSSAFPRVLAAEAGSNFGSMLSRLAIPWLAALLLQATPAQMALLLVADVLAAALGSLLLSGWIDRSSKRAVMVWADALRLVLLAGLAWATWQGQINFGLLLAVSAANGVLGVGFELARSAWVAQAMPVASLPRSNAQLSIAGSLSETAAFALGGWLYQAAGAAICFAANALTFAFSALALRGVPASEPVASSTSTATPPSASQRRRLHQLLSSIWQDTSAGLRAVAQRPALRALAAIEVLGSLSFALTGTVYTIFVTRELGLPTSQLGMVAALGGLGAVLGAVMAPRLGRALGPGRTMTLGLLAFAAGAACIPMAQGLGWLALGWLVLHQIIGDAGHVLHDVHDRTLRQTAVPSELLARADAGIRSCGQLALLVGALAGGLLGTWAGSRPVLWLAVACALAAAAVAAMRLAERAPMWSAGQSGKSG